ncbi:MAG TPA: hypothetical protein VFJ62_12655 [Usitatibacter sp.]|nr:hypothetical protein [Usitatibacter sp.]
MIDFSTSPPTCLPAAPWHAWLDRAASVDHAVDLVRDYLAEVPPEALAKLPTCCRKIRVKAADDIEYWTYRLSEAHRVNEHDAPTEDLLHEIFSLLLHASLRLAQIERERVLEAVAAQ